MAFPAGVITRPVTFGPAFELEDGDVAGMTVAFKATRPGVLWMETGSPAVSVAITRNASDGVEQTVYLPVTDQEGWGDGDGNAIIPGEDGHVFLYSVSIVFTQDGRTIPGAQPRSKTIAIPQGDGSPLDLDKIIPLTSPGGTVVSVPDIWSGQIAAAEAAAASVLDSAEFMGSELADPSSPAAVAVSAKIVSTLESTENLTELLADAAAVAIGDAALDLNLRGRWPVVNIVTDGAAPILNTTDYVNGDYTITLTDGGVVHAGGLKIRGRGNSTWGLPKKPYRLNFDDNTSPLGMTASKKNWALLANHLDPAKINTALAFTLGSHASGLDWTPQYRYVEVVLNGDYLGIYTLTDLVRLESGRVAGTAAGTTGLALTGTYLLELDNKEAGTVPGWTTPRGQFIAYDDPDGTNGAQAAYIQSWMSSFEEVLYSNYWLDPTAGYHRFIDMDSFVDWYLINELAANHDSQGWSSCKAVKERDTASVLGRLKMGPLWDFDLAFGVGWDGPHPPEGFWTKSMPWITRMFADPDFRSALSTRFAALVAAMGDVNLFVDKNVDALADATRRDQTRWNYTAFGPVVADARKKWISTRIAWLTTQFAGDIDPYPTTYATTY